MDQYFRNWWHRHGRAVACFQSVALALCLSALAPTQAASQTNLPPTVALTAPAGGSSAPVGSDVVVFAAAADQNGSVVRVDFYDGGTLIASDTSAPFWIVWNTSVPGGHVLTAIARDNNGATTTSAAVAVTRTPSVEVTPAVTLTVSAASYTAPAALSLRANISGTPDVPTEVRFYAGSTLIGWSVSPPFAIPWTAGVGLHTLKAVATMNSGTTASSADTQVAVTEPLGNVAPSVALTSPTATNYAAPAAVALAATASDSDGTVARVDFYRGTTLLGSDTSAPYAFAWANVPAGTYTLTAVARDTQGATATSAPVVVTVATTPANLPPIVTLVTNADTYTAPATVFPRAFASDPDGSISRVDIFIGSTLHVSDTTDPYRLSWGSAPAGTYVLTAVAYDDRGASTTSAPVQIVITGTAPPPPVGNVPPVVSLAASGAPYAAPAAVALAATASDSDGTVARVDFYRGTTLLGSDTSAPYAFAWANVPAGTYTLTAVARDTQGATATSAPLDLTVEEAVAGAENAAPSVTIISLSGSPSLLAPATVSIEAEASDEEGIINRVEFFAGGTYLGADTSAPFEATWANAPGGRHVITAIAFDEVENFGVDVSFVTVESPGGSSSGNGPVIVTNPTKLGFQAPVNHESAVNYYVLEIFTAGVDPSTWPPVEVVNLGKPAAVYPEIIVNIESLVMGLPAGRYRGRVTGVGALGSASSTLTNEFIRD